MARRMPHAQVWGLDIGAHARRACRATAAANGVRVHIGEHPTPQVLSTLVHGRTLIVVDVEGAELELLDPDTAPALGAADILVELHEFWRPGSAEQLLERFPRREPLYFGLTERDPAQFPQLAPLSPADRRHALDERRDPDQRWLWLPAD